MNQIWIRYQEIWSKEYVTKNFCDAEEAKNLVDYLRKHPKYFRFISCGGFEDEDGHLERVIESNQKGGRL